MSAVVTPLLPSMTLASSMVSRAETGKDEELLSGRGSDVLLETLALFVTSECGVEDELEFAR